jgi:hypothetical protein
MPVHILTQRNAPNRQGINREETQLNPDTVRFDNFGKLGTYPVEGFVFAQPLFVSGVDCGAKGLRDLVIIATMENLVYAFDASQTGAEALVWPAVVPPKKGVKSDRFENYGDFYGLSIGILSTPVIELNGNTPSGGAIFLVGFELDEAKFNQNGKIATAEMFQHILYALDLGTGNVLRKTVIAGQFPGKGYGATMIPAPQNGVDNNMRLNAAIHVDPTKKTISAPVLFDGKPVTVTDVTGHNTPTSVVHFNSMMQLQRPGLLLQGNNLFVAFGSRGDKDPYHGWLFTYDKTSFQQTGIFCTTPNGARGGIWQAGQGLIQDSKQNVYACTGNGDNDKRGTGQILVGRNLGESFVGFRFDLTGLRLNGWFSLFKDFQQDPAPETAADDRDDDFGAGAPALLPDDRVVAGGKDGWFFLIDPDQLDKNSNDDALPQAFKASFNVERGSRTGNVAGRTTRHIHGSPVVWDTGTGKVFVYVWGENDVVRVYQYAPETGQDPASGRFIQPPSPRFVFGTVPPQGEDFARGDVYASNEVIDRHGMPGGFLSLSVNGHDPASAILWATYPPFADANQQDVAGSLAAYQAGSFDKNLAYRRVRLLWKSQQNPADKLGSFVKFCVPTVASGRVYQVTGDNEVAIYGVKPTASVLNLAFKAAPQGFALNGSARISGGGGVVLTDAAQKTPQNGVPHPTFHAGSFFTRGTFDVGKFVTSFTFQLQQAEADGFAFVIQAEGPHAVGSAGSGLGYAPDPFAPFPPNMRSTILHSFAVRFSLRDAQGNQVSHLGLQVNGLQVAGFVDIDLLQTNNGPINFRSGNRITVTLRYDGTTLFTRLHDEGTNIFSPDFPLLPGNIPQQINSVLAKAFVGFTGGTGGLSAQQEIVAWSFQGGVFA